MKILFLQDDFPPQSFGGAGISAYELALEMKKAGHEISVITTCRNQNEEGKTDYDGLTVFKIASNYSERWRWYLSLYNCGVVKKVEKILSELSPDVVHVHNIHTHLSYYSLKLAKRHARATVMTFRDVMAFSFAKLDTKKYLENQDVKVTWLDQIRQAGKRWNPFRNIIIRHYLKYADRKFAISYALKDALAQNGINDVEVIYNGINVSEWKASDEEVKDFKKKHQLENKKVIFFNGRLSPAKGSEQALEAVRLVRKEFSEAVLLVAGTGNMEPREGLIFTGWLDREEIKLVYTASDLVLMPSVCFDAFGRVNIEAMASKKPIIGTRFGGTPEIVEDGQTGYIVNPLYPEQIAEKTLILLKNPERAKQFGQVGYARAQKCFNLHDKAIEYQSIYLYLCSS